MSFQPNPSSQWRKICSIGLCPDITSFEVYTERYVRQLQKAILESSQLACPVPGPDEILAFHKVVFRGIHPWAGTFRGQGESVFFDQGVVGADSSRIASSLERLQEKTTSELESAPTPSSKAMIVAGYLGALRRIHPFRDGNTRTAVVALYGQTAAIFGPKDRPVISSLDFKDMLRDAYQGHLGGLTNQILVAEGLPAIPISEGETLKTSPSLDVDMETHWQQERERIIQQQRGTLRVPKPTQPPGKPEGR